MSALREEGYGLGRLLECAGMARSSYYYALSHPKAPTRPELWEAAAEIFSRTANGCGHRQIAMCLRAEQGVRIAYKTTLKLARPAGVKLVIKSVDDSIEALRSGVTDKYRLFIVVESIEDAYRLAKGYSEIKHINIGGTKPREGADVRLSSTVFATDRDVELLHELSDAGIEVEIRQVPRDEKILI